MGESTRAFNEIRDELVCPICQDILKLPKILDCVHCVCEKCLVTLIRTAKQDERRSFNCPACNQPYEIQPGEADAYKTQFTLSNIIEILEKYEAEMFEEKLMIIKCSNADDGNAALAYCSKCQCFFCEECYEVHARMKATRRHQTVLIADIKADPKKMDQKRYCIEHEGEELKLYCEVDEEVICRDCEHEEWHKKHDHQLVKNVLPKLRETLERLVGAVRRKSKEFDEHLAYIDHVALQSDKNINSCHQMIEEFFEKHHTQLKADDSAAKTQLHQSLEVSRSEYENRIAAEKDAVELSKVNLVNALAFTVQLLKEGTQVDIAMMSKQMKNRLTDLQKKSWDKKALQPTNLAFFGNERDPLNSLIRNGITCSHIIVEGLMQPVRGTNQFNVSLDKGVEANNGIVVTLTRNGERVQNVVEVANEDSHCWNVKYQISAEGEYEIGVFIDGVEAEESPFKRIWYERLVKGTALPAEQNVCSSEKLYDTKNSSASNQEMLDDLKILNNPNDVTKLYKDAEVQFNYTVPVKDHLCGAHIAGEKLYLIQGSSPQSLDWDKYGFRMYYPQHTLPPQETSEVAVYALLGGNFKFPEGTELVSAVYYVSFAKEVNQPIKVGIQHCVALRTKEQESRLSFVTTSTGDSNCEEVFEIVKGGQFCPCDTYGFTERIHFSSRLIAIVKWLSGWFWKDSNEENDEEESLPDSTGSKYKGCMLYRTMQLNKWEVKFHAYKDIKVYEQLLEEECQRTGVCIGQQIFFAFDDTEIDQNSYIELYLPEQMPSGWTIHPDAEPLILKKGAIDRYGSSEHRPLFCRIVVYGSEIPGRTKPLHYPVLLRGVECDTKKLFINCSLVQVKPSIAGSESGVYDIFNCLKEKSAHWNDFARELRISYKYHQELERSTQTNDQKLEEVIKKWIDAKTCDVSWNMIISVLEKLDFIETAAEMKEFIK